MTTLYSATGSGLECTSCSGGAAGDARVITLPGGGGEVTEKCLAAWPAGHTYNLEKGTDIFGMQAGSYTSTFLCVGAQDGRYQSIRGGLTGGGGACGRGGLGAGGGLDRPPRKPPVLPTHCTPNHPSTRDVPRQNPAASSHGQTPGPRWTSRAQRTRSRAFATDCCP